ncbi:MAG: hypothetical protein JST30_00415 [Armatimonadetes bacterium]|nr:hypothetical protein [Armatimonadota bacterium]
MDVRTEEFTRHTRLTIFGETKTVRDWFCDKRCPVDEETVLRRLEQGEDAEEAVTRPVHVVRAVAQEREDSGRTSPPVRERRSPDELLTAWGETKTLREWSLDPRCTVRLSMIELRLSRGWPPEDVLDARWHRPEGRKNGRLVTAFGETKCLSDWARDERCTVSVCRLRDRLEEGMDPERAVTKPVPPGTKGRSGRRLSAFGESKTIAEWSRDPRCSVSTSTIRSRIKKGLSTHEAVSLPGPSQVHARSKSLAGAAKASAHDQGRGTRSAPKSLQDRAASGRHDGRALAVPQSKKARRRRIAAKWKGRKITIFGKDKTLLSWSRDPRCQVDLTVLAGRLDRGWKPKAALTTPKCARRPGKVRKHTVDPIWCKAFGERKRLTAWTQDDRCTVSRDLLAQRLRTGWEPERAVTTPKTDAVRRRATNPSLARPLTVFGETKTVAEWADDPRCRPSLEELKRRLKWGWTPEEAVTTAVGDRSRMVAKSSRYLTAWGETKTLRLWADDPRCLVTFNALKARVSKDYTAEEAMTAPVGVKRAVPKRPDEGKVLTAFGETKNVAAWSRDPRCVTTVPVLYRRLGKGWPLERALTSPMGTRADGSQGPSDGLFRPLPVWEAFGEKKGLADWARDPRCVVSVGTLSARLKNGWSVEEALKTPLMGYGAQRGKTAVRNKNFIAFGEVKPVKRWANDPRCAVDLEQLVKRLMGGWDIERAMTQPLRETRRTKDPQRRRQAA